MLKNLFNLKEKPITQDEYVIRRKLNILELGETLGNISEACRKLGVSRQHHYNIKSAVEEDGVEGLLEKSRKVPRIGNWVAPEIEQKVLDYSLEFPTHGQKRVSKVRDPQTNGSTKRLDQIIQNEFYKVAFRKKIYKSIEEIQVVLDTFMKNYNAERTKQAKHCEGRTPMQNFQGGRPLYQQ